MVTCVRSIYMLDDYQLPPAVNNEFISRDASILPNTDELRHVQRSRLGV